MVHDDILLDSYINPIGPVFDVYCYTVGAELLVLGVACPLVHGGDGEIIWGLDGLDIGVVDFLM